MAWRGTEDGKRLKGLSKAIAVSLICRAQQKFRYKCIVTDEDLAGELDIHRDSVKKYVDPLVELGLVSYAREGERGRKIYDCAELFRRFGEERGQPKQKISDLAQMQMRKDSASSQTPKVSASGKLDAESVVLDAESVAADAETVIPDAESSGISSISSLPSLSSSLIDVSALARALGIKDYEGYEGDVFAIADHLTRFGFTKRRQRHLVSRFGIASLTGAIGYVVEQMRLQPGQIRKPDGLFMYALREHIRVELPRDQTSEVSASDVGVPASVDQALKAYVQRRIGSEVFYKMFIEPSTIVVDQGGITITCESAFSASNLRPKAEMLSEAAKAVLGVTLPTMVVVKGEADLPR
jgi:hypothetical protein